MTKIGSEGLDINPTGVSEEKVMSKEDGIALMEEASRLKAEMKDKVDSLTANLETSKNIVDTINGLADQIYAVSDKVNKFLGSVFGKETI